MPYAKLAPLLCAWLAVAAQSAHAQDALGLYHWAAVPARLTINPALPVTHRAWLRPPVIGHVDQNVQLPWALTDVVELRGNSLRATLDGTAETAFGDLALDVPALLDGLEGTGQARITTRVNLLGLGVQTPAGLFTLDADQRLDAQGALSESPLAGLYFGEAYVRANGVDVRSAAYDGLLRTSVSLGFQRAIPNTPWRLGASLRLTKAQAHAQLLSIDVDIDPGGGGGPVVVSFEGSQRVAGIADVNEGETDIADLTRSRILEGGNYGVALDVGVHYEATERLDLSASVTELGLQRLDFQSAEYLFRNSLSVGESQPLANLSTVDVEQGIDEVTGLDKDGLDTLLNRDPYTRPQPTAIYLGGEYRFAGENAVGLVLQNSLRGGRVQSAAALSLNLRPWRVLEAHASVSYSSVGGVGLGFGASLQLAVLQVYAGTDHVVGLADVEGARRLSAVAGVTLLLPQKRDEDGLGTLRPKRARGRGVKCYRF